MTSNDQGGSAVQARLVSPAPEAQQWRKDQATQARDGDTGVIPAVVDPDTPTEGIPAVRPPTPWLSETEGIARQTLEEKYGKDWATRGDLPETVQATVFEKEGWSTYQVPTAKVREWHEHYGQTYAEQAAARDAAWKSAADPWKAKLPPIVTDKEWQASKASEVPPAVVTRGDQAKARESDGPREPSAAERAAAAKDRRDVEANAHLLKEPPSAKEGFVMPDINQLIPRDKGTQKARMEARGVTDKAAAEAVALSKVGQAQPASQIPIVPKGHGGPQQAHAPKGKEPERTPTRHR